MPAIKLILEGDDCWPDLLEKYTQGKVVDLMGNEVPPIELAALPGGMASGATSVTLRIALPDDGVLLTETSLALLGTAVRAIEARYEQANATRENTQPLDRLRQFLSHMESLATQDLSLPLAAHIVGSVGAAREEIETWLRQQAQARYGDAE